ncbi:MAG TPA: CoA transferase [Acidimicrobiia bacterium]|nr:CoA transferase [Acidimicrobiia bacterium]
MRQALSDVRVLEVGTGVAAGWCGKVFADLGADVVKVEPPDGDSLRADRGMWAHLNTNKGSAAVEIAPAAAGTLRELLDGVDLVIETPGMRGLTDWAVAREDVIGGPRATSVLAITGFGTTGPYADYRWSDLVVQALSGAVVNDERGPLKLPMSLGETAVGHTAALAGLAAVLRARATGVGAFVDCAAVEALASSPMRLSLYLGWEYSGHTATHQRTPNSSDTLLPIGIFPCADGYVAMMMTTQQLGEMLTVLDSDELRAAFARPDAFVRPETKEILDGVLYPWLLERTREEVTVAAQAGGWPLAPVNEPAELLAADHLHQRGFWVHAVDQQLGPVLLAGAPYRLTEGGWKLRRGAPRLDESTPAAAPGWGVQSPAPAVAVGDPALPPLRGIRVVDLTNVWSGPYLTQLLGDLGAEVIRVESPRVFPPTTKGYAPRPEPQLLLGALAKLYAPAAPGQPDRPYNRHAMNNAVTRGKLSCTLDVRFPEQRELFMRLVAVSDVFVENLKSTTLHQMGIHETELLQANPRMIVLRLPPAGLSGDWAHYTGFGGQFDGLTSLAALLGHRGTTLMESPSTQHMDSVTGPAGAFATLAALHYRAATGRGQVIELAQSENVLTELGDVFVNLQLGVEPQRFGNRDPHRAPQGIYPCADGRRLALTVVDDDAWRGLTGVLARSDLAKDNRLADHAGRWAAHDELDDAITAWAATVTADAAFHALQEARVAAAPCTEDATLATDPQLAAREWIRPLASRDVGTFNHLGHPFRGIPLVWERGAPVLGQDNEYVFKEILGVDDAEYDRFVAERVATEDYLDRDGRPC